MFPSSIFDYQLSLAALFVSQVIFLACIGQIIFSNPFYFTFTWHMDYQGKVSTKVPFASVSKWAYVHTIHMMTTL